MHPLCRWQFRGGIAEKDRKAFLLFTNVIDSKGRKYDIPVLVGGLASNREIYRLASVVSSRKWTIDGFVPSRTDCAAHCGKCPVPRNRDLRKALDKPGNA